jgi:hypothetical protein
MTEQPPPAAHPGGGEGTRQLWALLTALGTDELREVLDDAGGPFLAAFSAGSEEVVFVSLADAVAAGRRGGVRPDNEFLQAMTAEDLPPCSFFAALFDGPRLWAWMRCRVRPVPVPGDN